MSMQNQSKLLTQLKDYFNKSVSDKNLQTILSKDWIDFLQKVTYSQINTLKRFSPIEFTRGASSDKTTGSVISDDARNVNNNKTETENTTSVSQDEEKITASSVKYKKVGKFI